MRVPIPGMAPVVWVLLAPIAVVAPVLIASACIKTQTVAQHRAPAPAAPKAVEAPPTVVRAALGPAYAETWWPGRTFAMAAPSPTAALSLAAKDPFATPQIPAGLQGDWILEGTQDDDDPPDRRTLIILTQDKVTYRNPGPEAKHDLYETITIQRVEPANGWLRVTGVVADGRSVPDNAPSAEDSAGQSRTLRLQRAPGGALSVNGLYGQDLPLDYVRQAAGSAL